MIQEKTAAPYLQKVNRHAPRIGEGIFRLNDIKARCYADPDSGCWVWRTDSEKIPRAFVGPGVVGEKAAYVAVRRVGWLLSGRRIKDGHVVWRCCEGDVRCVNPAHAQSGSHAKFAAFLREKGLMKCTVGQMRAGLLRAQQTVISREKFEQISAEVRRARDVSEGLPKEASPRQRQVALSKAGLTYGAIAQRHSVSTNVVGKVTRGEHHYCRPAMAMPASSAFAMAASMLR